MTNAKLLTNAIQKIQLITDTPQLDAEVLLAHAIETTREQIITNQQSRCSAPVQQRFSALLEARAKGIPVSYLTGKKEFYGIDFTVTPDVLVPRPETELIIDEAQKLYSASRTLTIADIGTGSGCIAITLATLFPKANVIASDISVQALVVAKKNAERAGIGGRITFIQSTIAEHLQGKHVSLITANLPYLPTKEARAVSARYNEPLTALDGGPNGTELYKALFKQLRHLTTDAMLIEIDPRETKHITHSIYQHCDCKDARVVRDLAGNNRVIKILFS